MIRVQDPGLSTTVQDDGRHGHYHIGMPPSGAMDQFSAKVANYLVGNDGDAAVLEMTYKGAELSFYEDAVVAVTGASMQPSVGEDEHDLWTSFPVQKGETLSFDFPQDGARTYVAVAGGIDVPTYMDSRSTYTLCGLGGHKGRTLEEGDELPIGDAEVDLESVVGRNIPDQHRPSFGDDAIRVVMGLCDYRLTEEDREALLEGEWKVSTEADRVGYRLEGPEIDFESREQPFGAGPDPSNVVDLGYPVGSIQVPEQPIVLMRDAVTGGGYATVGTVISVDRGKLAQRQTHQTVTFEEVTVNEAHEAREAHEQTLEAIRDTLT